MPFVLLVLVPYKLFIISEMLRLTNETKLRTARRSTLRGVETLHSVTGATQRAGASGFGGWRRQLVGLYDALEGGAFVRAIAEGLAFREATAAEADLGASA